MRIYAARAMGRLGGPDAVAALAQALKDNAWEVRAVAARALGACRDAGALPHLQAALTDPHGGSGSTPARPWGPGGAGRRNLRQALGSDTFARDMAAQMLEKLHPRSAS